MLQGCREKWEVKENSEGGDLMETLVGRSGRLQLQDKSWLRVGLEEGPEDWGSRCCREQNFLRITHVALLQALEHDTTSCIYFYFPHAPFCI